MGMVELRKLEYKDINNIIEDFKDHEGGGFFWSDISLADVKTVKAFIDGSFCSAQKYYAILNDGKYSGAVGLKNIQNGQGEYSVFIRKCAEAEEAALEATMRLLNIAFYKTDLKSIQADIPEDDIFLKELYKKCFFDRFSETEKDIMQNGGRKRIKAYYITREKYLSYPHIIYFDQMGDERGKLVVIEQKREAPFSIKRIFYIYDSDKDVVRGQHANINSEFVLVNICGTSRIRTDDGHGDVRVYSLDKPHMGVYIPKMVWKDIYDFKEGSILLCISSEHYDAGEYIRDYDKFLEITDK